MRQRERVRCGAAGKAVVSNHSFAGRRDKGYSIELHCGFPELAATNDVGSSPRVIQLKQAKYEPTP